MQVGIRELKAKLSEYIAAAADGSEITVTDRGKPVARLIGLEGASGIERGIEQGWIEPPRRRSLAPVERHKSGTSTASALDEDRG